uniref:Peptidase C1A papain C-terminal domain-containing protein n=1 Tax=Globodera rostochiensis TaxID=31243 RepID=A0A914HWN2_GLORO
MIAVGIVLLNFINLFILCAGNVPRMQLEKSFANSAALVAHVNARQTSWTAELHPQFANMPPEALNRLMGVRGPFPEKRQRVPSGNEYNGNFDARKHFPKCAEVISTIQDQGLCGSCWAVSAASVISDRICIASDGQRRANISALDLLSCEPRSFGCDGGSSKRAFEFYEKSGLCTGSNFESQLGCKPYPWPSVTHPAHGPLHETPKCAHFCRNSNYTLTYAKDKFYGKNARTLTDGNVEAIKAEIIRAGPVTAAFLVYEDFPYYAKGIYQHIAGKIRGGHAVRIVGWGYDMDSKLPYWLIANSWNRSWGEEGFFRIRMGTDECGIETWGISYADPEEL